jgi:hypothetical protein
MSSWKPTRIDNRTPGAAGPGITRNYSWIGQQRIDRTDDELPALSRWKKSTPGPMSSTDPPLAIAVISTPLAAALAVVGSPLRATLPLNSGRSRSLTPVRSGTLDESSPMDSYPP